MRALSRTALFDASQSWDAAAVKAILSRFRWRIAGKWLSMLKEVAPATSRGLLMANRKITRFDYFQGVLPAAASFGIRAAVTAVTRCELLDRLRCIDQAVERWIEPFDPLRRPGERVGTPPARARLPAAPAISRT